MNKDRGNFCGLNGLAYTEYLHIQAQIYDILLVLLNYTKKVSYFITR